jgi:hypothetical protein
LDVVRESDDPPECNDLIAPAVLFDPSDSFDAFTFGCLIRELQGLFNWVRLAGECYAHDFRGVKRIRPLSVDVSARRSALGRCTLEPDPAAPFNT